MKNTLERWFVLVLAALCLAGCGGRAAPGTSAPPVGGASGGTSVPAKQKGGEDVPFTVEQVSIAAFPEQADNPHAVLLGSPAELASFYEENREAYGLDGPLLGEESAFLAATRELDEAFFTENSLVLVFLQAGNSGVQHEVQALVNEGGGLSVELERRATSEMAAAVISDECYLLRVPGRFSGGTVRVVVKEKA